RWWSCCWSASREWIGRSVRARYVGQRYRVPGSGIDGADGVARDIGIVQRIDVEINAFDRSQPLGQGAQQLGKFARFQLGFRHADGPEAKAAPGGDLREPSEVGRNHGCDLGIAATG